MFAAVGLKLRPVSPVWSHLLALAPTIRDPTFQTQQMAGGDLFGMGAMGSAVAMAMRSRTSKITRFAAPWANVMPLLSGVSNDVDRISGVGHLERGRCMIRHLLPGSDSSGGR
ncbi:hypothetical protein BMW22_02050 [Rhizobium leguminosarum]|uniref:Uncharacterized protein n=1 Tax=Rhizobium leguminosarum TaxID=384 RepID=A0A1L3Z4I6_RHILE|nr:hypothetical protein BMW22_02050 [Rhizobium leguminosarum]